MSAALQTPAPQPADIDGRIDAIEAGLSVRKVWLAVCEEYDVPPKER